MSVKTHWKLRFSCGHVETKDLTTKPAHERKSYAQAIARKYTCSSCYRKAQGKPEWIEDKQEWLAQKRAAEQEAAATWTDENHMPPLSGSEKAVDWGSRVRYELYAALYRWAVEEGHADEDTYQWALDAGRTLDRATWWITNRTQDEDEQTPTNSETFLELLASAAETGAGSDCDNPYS